MKTLITAVLCVMPGLNLWAGTGDQAPIAIAIAGVLADYQRLSAAGAPEFYDLYAEDARIVMEMAGRPGRTIFKGHDFKNWGKALIAREQAVPDASRFEGLTVERHGARVLLHARRYSLTRCAWDAAYRLTLAAERGNYRIVEEHLALSPSATCASAPLTVAVPSTTRLPPAHATWRPMSPEEISATALKLAPQVPTRKAADAQGLPEQTASPGAHPPMSELWIQPQD